MEQHHRAILPIARIEMSNCRWRHTREMRHHHRHHRAVVDRLRLCLEYREHDRTADAFDVAAGWFAKIENVDILAVGVDFLAQWKRADPRLHRAISF